MYSQNNPEDQINPGAKPGQSTAAKTILRDVGPQKTSQGTMKNIGCYPCKNSGGGREGTLGFRDEQEFRTPVQKPIQKKLNNLEGQALPNIAQSPSKQDVGTHKPEPKFTQTPQPKIQDAEKEDNTRFDDQDRYSPTDKIHRPMRPDIQYSGIRRSLDLNQQPYTFQPEIKTLSHSQPMFLNQSPNQKSASLQTQLQHNTRISNVNRRSRHNISLNYSQNPFQNLSQSQSSRNIDWGLKNQQFYAKHKSKPPVPRLSNQTSPMNPLSDQLTYRQKVSSFNKPLESTYNSQFIGYQKKDKPTMQKKMPRSEAKPVQKGLTKDQQTKELQELETRMLFSRDERIAKPLVNLDMNCQGKDHYHEDKKDLHTHRVKEEIERVEIEQYLNQGEGDFVDSLLDKKGGRDFGNNQDHPQHRIDPQLETLKNQGNFKYTVSDPEHEHHGLICPPCINRELIHEHERLKNFQDPETGNPRLVKDEISFLDKLGTEHDLIHQRVIDNLNKQKASWKTPLNPEVRQLQFDMEHAKGDMDLERDHLKQSQRKAKLVQDLKNEAQKPIIKVKEQERNLGGNSTLVWEGEQELADQQRRQMQQQWIRDIQKQIRGNEARARHDKEKSLQEDQAQQLVDQYYHNQYPMYKNEYPLGEIQPCANCETLYPAKKMQHFP